MATPTGGVPCPVCQVRPAPNEQGKCSECASAAVDEWRERKNRREIKGETAAERKARLARMGSDDYRALREGDRDG